MSWVAVATGVGTAVGTGVAGFANKGGGSSGGGLNRQLDLQEAIAQPQIDYLRSTLPVKADTAKQVGGVISDRFKNPGLPTPFQNSLIRTAKDRIGQNFKQASTRGSELLASKGLLGSKASLALPLNLERDRAAGEREFESNLLGLNYQDLLNTIQAAINFQGGGPSQLSIPGVNIPQESGGGSSELLGQLAALAGDYYTNKKGG